MLRANDIKEAMKHRSKHGCFLITQQNPTFVRVYFVHKGSKFGILKNLYGTSSLSGYALCETQKLERVTVEAPMETPYIDVKHSIPSYFRDLFLCICAIPCCIPLLCSLIICPSTLCGPNDETVQELKELIDRGNKWIDDSIKERLNQESEIINQDFQPHFFNPQMENNETETTPLRQNYGFQNS